jgi:hypothetical protein
MQRFDFPAKTIPHAAGSTKFTSRTGLGKVQGLSMIFREAFFTPRKLKPRTSEKTR